MTLPLDSRFNLRRRYLLGISGGGDSVALLHTLLDAGCGQLVLCHLNHQLRGLYSAHDAAFVRELAEDLGLPFEIARDHVQRRAEEGNLSIELAAREARHEFFAACAARQRCNRVLLAHHADDNAETILFNLLRGSAGLKGIRYESTHTIGRRKLTFLRPLLHVRRSEIDAFLDAHRLRFRDDASNDEPFTPRNRLRNEIFPLLEEIMDRDFVPAMARAAESGHEDQDCLDELLEFLDLLDPRGRLHLPKLRKLPDPLQRRALFSYLQRKRVPDLSRDLLTRSLALLDPEAPAKLNLPGGKHLRRRAGRIFIE